MIPRGADFPPDSAPPAKRSESATMGTKGPPCLLPLPVPLDFPEAKTLRAPGKALPCKLRAS